MRKKTSLRRPRIGSWAAMFALGLMTVSVLADDTRYDNTKASHESPYKAPKKMNGIEQKPMEGTSFAYTLADDAANAPDRKKGKKFGVFPLDDRFTGRLQVERPSFAAGRTKFEYYDTMNSLPEGAAPNVKNKSHTIIVDGGGPGKGGKVTLSANGKKVGEGRLEKTVPVRFSLDNFGIGQDLNAPVIQCLLLNDGS